VAGATPARVAGATAADSVREMATAPLPHRCPVGQVAAAVELVVAAVVEAVARARERACGAIAPSDQL